MRKYFIKTPWIVRKIFPHYLWKMDINEKVLYLTFDDGPHPEITPYVLEQLKAYKAQATFFCVGDNVIKYPGVYQQLRNQGHTIGNHTFHHLNGWSTADEKYLEDIKEAAGVIDSTYFRPPYGRIKSRQAKLLPTAMLKDKVDVVMWDVLSADFDTNISPRQCLNNVIRRAGKGSIIVFHDSEKALPNMQAALPGVLKHFSEKGYQFRGLTG